MRGVLGRVAATRALTVPVTALVFLALNLLDGITTTYALQHGQRELNPISAAVLNGHGMTGYYVTKTAVVCVTVLALSLLPRRVAAWSALVLTVLMAAVVVSNVETLFS